MTRWMDPECIMLNEMSDREGQILHDCTYMWNLNNETKQNRNRLIDTENKLVVARGVGGVHEIGEGD